MYNNCPIYVHIKHLFQGEESPSNTIRRILSRGSLENNVQELLHRGSPGTTKTTTVTSSTPGAKTITKTVITEKEELSLIHI